MAGKLPCCLLGCPSSSMCREAWALVPGELFSVVSHLRSLVHRLLCMTSECHGLQSIMQTLTLSEAKWGGAHIISPNLVLPDPVRSPQLHSQLCP